MQAAIHPQYFEDAQVICACGNTWTTGSTKQIIKVEICSNCHPFYTGAQKFVDTVGKVQKFQAKQAAAATKQASAKQKIKAKEEDEHRPKSLREMLQGNR